MHNPWQRLDHTQKFSLIALVCVFAVAVLSGWLLRTTLYGTAQAGENRLTASVVRHQFKRHVPTSLFLLGEPITDQTFGLRLLDALSLEDVFRIKLYGADGQIIWSDEPKLLGRRFPDNEFLNRALRGEIVSVIETPHRTEHVFERGSFEQVLEVYVPIEEGDSIIGVAEIYRHPEAFFRETRKAARLLWLATLIGGAFVYLAMVGVVRRISNHQRRLEAQLRRYADDLVAEKDKLHDIVNAVGAGLVLVDQEGRIQWANQRAELWFGTDQNLIGSNSHRMLCRKDERCEKCPFDSPHPQKLPAHCECRVPGDNGGERLFEIITTQPSLVGGSDPERTCFLQLVLDVTEARETEVQLQQATKVALMGQLAGGVAHEINNPVGILLTTITHHLTRSHAQPASLASDLEMMERQCRRIDHSVRSLLNFTRDSKGKYVPVDLKAIIEEAILLAQPRSEQMAIRVETRLDENPCITTGDPNHLLQVVLTLVNNAIDAMPDGGTLALDLRAFQTGQCRRDEQPRLRITVADSGEGLPVEDADRIFEPFFTTKEIGSGTGLGLAVSKRIVESVAGTICARNGPDGGAVFEVYLPFAESARDH